MNDYSNSGVMLVKLYSIQNKGLYLNNINLNTTIFTSTPQNFVCSSSTHADAVNFKGSKQASENKHQSIHSFIQKANEFKIKSYQKCIKWMSNLEIKMKAKERKLKETLEHSPVIINDEKCDKAKYLSKLRSEKNIEERKKVYNAVKTKFGKEHLEEFKELVNLRNEVAKEKGYKNYFDYALIETYGTTPEELNKILETLENTTNEPFERTAAKKYKAIADSFGVKIEELQPWHYDYIPENNIFHSLENHLKEHSVKGIVMNMYKNMGWNIDIDNPKCPIKLIEQRIDDMAPARCQIKKPNKDVRITYSQSNDLKSLQSLSHELGHAVYGIGFDKELSKGEMQPSSKAMTEAIALLFQSLPGRENIFKGIPSFPPSFAEQLKQNTDEKYIFELRNQLLSINFEKEIYNNPNQDLGALWYKLENSLLKTNKPKIYDNAWGSVPHYITHAGYYQNYLRGEVIANQIYEEAVKQNGLLTQSKKTAKFFIDNIFQHGKNWTDNKIITSLTNQPINTEAICNRIKQIK